MLATAAVTAAVVIPAGIGWLTRFGNVDWERLALRLLDRDRDDLEPQIKPLATRRLNEENAARQAQSASGLLRFELPPRPVSDNPQLDAARAAEYTALRQRCEVEQATWNAEHRRWQRARAPLAAALVQADLEGPRADARRPPGEGEGNAAAEEAESAAEQTLAQCAPDGSGARGEAWLGYEEVGELRERQRRAFHLSMNARRCRSRSSPTSSYPSHASPRAPEPSGAHCASVCSAALSASSAAALPSPSPGGRLASARGPSRSACTKAAASGARARCHRRCSAFHVACSTSHRCRSAVYSAARAASSCGLSDTGRGGSSKRSSPLALCAWRAAFSSFRRRVASGLI
eukprot:Transcript_21113.p2 GENE.Transcript_21113~~Transcript_21113.p2  ORF type:complete len:347 (-),score=57.40 Transcript_21113:248-1288(-)